MLEAYDWSESIRSRRRSEAGMYVYTRVSCCSRRVSTRCFASDDSIASLRTHTLMLPSATINSCVRCDPEPYRSFRMSDKQNVEASLEECRVAGHKIENVDLSGLTSQVYRMEDKELSDGEADWRYVPGFTIASSSATGGRVVPIGNSQAQERMMQEAFRMARESHPEFFSAFGEQSGKCTGL